MRSEGSEPAGEPVVCCDLDGVLWLGPDPIPRSCAAVGRLQAAGRRVAYLTNNSSRTPDAVVAQLAGMGVAAEADDVLTSAQAAAQLLARDLPEGARVLACAGEGVVAALTAVGFEVVATPPAGAVVVGWHRDFDYEGLDRAATAIRGGARFVATNVDPTYPGPAGPMPGNGAIVAAVATASGREAEVAGKPEAPMVGLVRARFGTRGVMVGDRPSTDGALATALGWPFALVLSGVAGEGGDEHVPDPRPAFVARDLASLVDDLLA